MNEWDKAYLKIKDPEPEEIQKDDSWTIFGYIAGCIFAFIFWLWFLIWVTSKI